MIGKDFNVKHKSSQLKGFGSKTCASLRAGIAQVLGPNGSSWSYFRNYFDAPGDTNMIAKGFKHFK
jgi:hypothetical protein